MYAILIVLFGIQTANAQYEELGDVLLDDDEMFEVNEVEDKYKNESAVVLAQKTKLIVRETEENQYTEFWVTRMKLKLQDKASVEFFSDFTISSSDIFEMNIIKPNGDVIEVDTNDAVPVNESFSLSSFYVNLSFNLVEYKKLAIRNLEIGDVIDYAYAEQEKHYSEPISEIVPIRKYNTWENFLSYSYAFGSSYPKMKQEFVIELDPSLYFNFKNLNGAPSPEVEELDNGNTQYTISMKDVPRQEDEYFSDSDVSNPKIKLELSYCSAYRYYRNPLLLGKQGEMNTEAGEERLKRAMFLNYHPENFDLLYFLNIYESDPDEFIRKAYTSYQRIIFDAEDEDYIQSNYYYAGNMYAALTEKGFDADIVLCVPRENGDIDEIVRSADLIYGVRVKDGNDYIYSFAFKKYSAFDDWDYRIVGTDAYAFKPTKKFKDFKFEEIEIPEYKPQNNKYAVELNVKLDIEEGLAEVKSETKMYGEIRTAYADDILLTSELEYEEDYNDIERLERYFERIEEIGQVNRLEMMEAWIEDDFELGKYKSFEIITSGMEDDNDVLNFKEHYTLTDIHRTAGEDYLVVDIGRLITPQIALMSDDRERQSDIIVEYVKQYEYTINFTIPEGYKIVGFDHLNTNVKTDAGTFRVSVSENKKGISVVSLKSYDTTFLPQSAWSEMEVFLDAAYAFSQQKLILVKE